MRLAKQISCSSCDVTVHSLKESGMDKAKEYGVISVPTVAVNGKLLDCSTRGKPTADDLKGGGQRNAAVNYFEALRCPPLQQ